MYARRSFFQLAQQYLVSVGSQIRLDADTKKPCFGQTPLRVLVALNPECLGALGNQDLMPSRQA